MKCPPSLLAAALLCAALSAHAEHGQHGASPASSATASSATSSGKPGNAANQAGRQSSWSSAPQLVRGMPTANRSEASFSLRNLQTTQVEVYGPGALVEPRPFAVADGKVSVSPTDTKLGNYHWLIASEEQGSEVRTASTAWYISNPGPAPTAMLATPHAGLLLVPQPLPREHGAYREGERWGFSVRFNGQPVPGAVVTLETEFASRLRAVADQQGNVQVLFPRDFDPAKLNAPAHGAMRPNSKFVLSSELERGGKHYLSAFNGSYNPDPTRQRDLALGAGFGLLGMLLATPLLRRKTDQKENPAHA